MPTATIIRHIESLGYAVAVRRIKGIVEMRAMKHASTEPPQIAKCNDGERVKSVCRADYVAERR